MQNQKIISDLFNNSDSLFESKIKRAVPITLNSLPPLVDEKIKKEAQRKIKDAEKLYAKPKNNVHE